MHGFTFWSHDPGPCPVDDTPHTACTPESLAVRLRSTPARDAVLQQLAQRRAARDAAPTFTTKTYRGKRPKATRARD
jgi:hypothetical protein